MDTNMMQHKKSVLFLVSLSKKTIQKIENKGVDYQFFMRTIRGYSHVEFHDTISEQLISTANLYRVVVIIGHQVDRCIELSDGSLFPMRKIVSALPSSFNGYLHVAVCGSSIVKFAIKERCPNSTVRTSPETTQLELQFRIYSQLLSHTDLSKENFSDRYNNIRRNLMEGQERKHPADLAKLPCATKLGEEPSEDVKTSVFAPKEVKATYTFPIQVFLYYSEKGTLVAKAKAEGIDPDTMPRLIQEPLTKIHKGDMIDVRLTMLDKDKQPTQNILVFYQEGTFTIPVKITEKETKVSFDVKVTEKYLYEECWALISFIDDNREKTCLNLEPFKIIITDTKDRSEGCDKSARIHSCIVAHENRLTDIPRVDRRLAQTEDLEEPSREDIRDQLLELVDKGPWKSEKIAEDVKQMLLTILGQGETILNDEESKLSCKLWDMLEKGRGNRVKTTWQNIVGFLVEEGLLCEKSTPALNLDFFPEEKYMKKKTHDNINKGKSEYRYNNHRFEDVIPLLRAYCPKCE